ncbi:hypothetical protein Tco_0152839 [Tanacetum coccineum]
MPTPNKYKNPSNNLKPTTRISVRACYFVNPHPACPPDQPLSRPADYQMVPPSTLNVSQPLSPITSLGIYLSKLMTTPKSTPPSLTSPPPASTQPSKTSSPLAINLDLVELIFLTPPTSPHALFDSLKDLPPKTTNPHPLRPLFESIERLANQPPLLSAMEPPLPLLPPQLPPLPPQLPPLGPNNPFLMLTHEMFCDHYVNQAFVSAFADPDMEKATEEQQQAAKQARVAEERERAAKERRQATEDRQHALQKQSISVCNPMDMATTSGQYRLMNPQRFVADYNHNATYTSVDCVHASAHMTAMCANHTAFMGTMNTQRHHLNIHLVWIVQPDFKS